GRRDPSSGESAPNHSKAANGFLISGAMIQVGQLSVKPGTDVRAPTAWIARGGAGVFTSPKRERAASPGRCPRWRFGLLMKRVRDPSVERSRLCQKTGLPME